MIWGPQEEAESYKQTERIVGSGSFGHLPGSERCAIATTAFHPVKVDSLMQIFSQLFKITKLFCILDALSLSSITHILFTTEHRGEKYTFKNIFAHFQFDGSSTQKLWQLCRIAFSTSVCKHLGTREIRTFERRSLSHSGLTVFYFSGW